MARENPAQPDPAQAALRALSGVGPRVEEKLARLGIHRIDHLLLHLPRNYEDRTRIVPLNELLPEQRCSVMGFVSAARVETYRGRRLRVLLEDDSGATLELLFMRFNRFQQDQLVEGAMVRAFGEVKLYGRKLRMFHPDYDILDSDSEPQKEERLTPVYSVTSGLAQVSLRKLIERGLDWAQENRGILEHSLWEELFSREGLPHFMEALQHLHAPPRGIDVATILSDTNLFRRRLIMEELAAYNLAFARVRERAFKRPATAITGGEALVQQFQERLPFTFTEAQQRVVSEIRQDMSLEQPMMRLLQGDVGSGKTVVAAAAALCAVDSGMQVAIMAPTELLAEQHYRCFQEWLRPMEIEVALLSSAQTRAQKTALYQQIQDHKIPVVVGTHALIQKGVEFDRLGLLIIDEQHRFGVHQRMELKRKGVQDGVWPHQLIMTATPIPRSLAMVVYGELEASILDELPPGRKPVTTVAMPEDKREELMQRIRKACLGGQQAYWVCTLVEDSEVLQCEAAESSWARLTEDLPDLEIGLVHGRMKAADKERAIERFKSGGVQLLVATTVIEVGVDVPSASLMVIENAERLGLAQLHQLRGRIGRSTRQSNCVMLYKPPLTENARRRIRIMRESNDGFAIAREDLRLRGPGQLLGAQQAGEMVFRVADLTRDEQQLRQVGALAREFLQQAPEAVDAITQRWLGEARHLGTV